LNISHSIYYHKRHLIKWTPSNLIESCIIIGVGSNLILYYYTSGYISLPSLKSINKVQVDQFDG